MGAHSFIIVGELWMLAARETYIPEAAALFLESELDEAGRAYESTGGEIGDRLRMLGITPERAKAVLMSDVKSWHSGLEDQGEAAGQGPAEFTENLLTALSRAVREDQPDPIDNDRFDEDLEPWLALEWKDARYPICLAVASLPARSAPVSYVLTDLVERGLLPRRQPIADQARAERLEKVTTDANLIVLTEGTTDSELLTLGLRVTHPHLVGSMTFMDFGNGTQGSVGDLPKKALGFAAAGVANRVLVLADNDAAAHEALKKLKAHGLPPNYRIAHYPDLEMLRSYPTIGSEGPSTADINGMGGSLELYLGSDVLAKDGKFPPIRVQNWVSAAGRYQGVLEQADKARVQKTFREKARVAIADPEARNGQDWLGVHGIIETILHAFD